MSRLSALLRSRIVACGSMGICVAASTVARADMPQAERNLAQALFDDARALMATEHYAEAGAKFAESLRVEPGGGTLINLAICHEKQGKIATAWADFHDALSAALREHRAERVQL